MSKTEWSGMAKETTKEASKGAAKEVAQESAVSGLKPNLSGGLPDGLLKKVFGYLTKPQTDETIEDIMSENDCSKGEAHLRRCILHLTSGAGGKKGSAAYDGLMFAVDKFVGGNNE